MSFNWKYFCVLLDFLQHPPINYSTDNYFSLSELIALAVTIIGFTLALELNLTTKNLKFNHPSNLFKFSNLLGYFPIIIHCSLPLTNLTTSQKSASILLDLIWLENVLPKSISYFQIKLSTIVSNQKGLIKLNFFSFIIGLIISLFLLSSHE